MMSSEQKLQVFSVVSLRLLAAVMFATIVFVVFTAQNETFIVSALVFTLLAFGFRTVANQLESGRFSRKETS